MSRHTTFRIGGPADAYVEIRSFEEFRSICSFSRPRALPLFLLGRGSKLLVLDGGIRGIVARLRGEFETMEFEPRGRVRAGAGVWLPTLVSACADKGLSGVESLSGIPGSVGGALVMNAGTREGAIGTVVRKVRVFEPERLADEWLGSDRIEFFYRGSNLEGKVLLGVELELKHGDKVDILERVHRFQEKRRQTQPIHTCNVGSTFKNPPARFAAELIERAGLKGVRCGGAKVSETHANFFENDHDATARDVLGLVELVRSRVRERYGVELELEMKVVGEA